MTTFDDTDLFEPVGDAGPVRPVRRGRVAVVLVVAATLVVAGVAWLLLARTADRGSAGDMTVSLLAREAQPTDQVAASVLDEVGIDPTTSRFAVRTAAGQHYAALRWSGDLCLVVVPTGDAARAVCVEPSRSAAVTLSAADGSRVRLVADGAPAPEQDDGWRPAGPNVWVLDAPAEG